MMISILITSNGRRFQLSSCLESIKNQKYKNFEIRVYENQNYPMRSRAYEQAKGEILFFLDEDCQLPDSNYLERLISIFENTSTCAVVGGAYMSLASHQTIQKAYNHLCKNWLCLKQASGDLSLGKTQNLLGGCFALKRSKMPPYGSQFFPRFWGGEDTLFFRRLQNQGFDLYYSKQLDVIHSPNPRWFASLKRAYLHGYRRFQFKLATPGTPSFFIKDKIPISYLPFYISHFSFLFLGSLTALTCGYSKSLKGIPTQAPSFHLKNNPNE